MTQRKQRSALILTRYRFVLAYLLYLALIAGLLWALARVFIR